MREDENSLVSVLTYTCPRCCSRPTAVNLSDAAHKLCTVADTAASAPGADAAAVVDAVVASCEAMLEADVLANRVALTLARFSLKLAMPQTMSRTLRVCYHAGFRQTWCGGFTESVAGQKSNKRQAATVDTL